MGISSNKENFVINAQKKHGDKYDYSNVNYIHSKSKVVIICPKHGEFLQRPNDHLTGYGCKMCQYKKTSKENRFTNEEFIEKANKIHSNTYDYSLVKYNGYENKIIVICSKHGKFQQTPHAHLIGVGCPICKESRGEKKVAEILMKNNIEFEREKTFPDLKYKSNLFYDFYLPKYNLFIEYQGVQHFITIEFFGGKKGLIERRKRDIIKYKYAVNNGYKIMWILNMSAKYLDELLMNGIKKYE